MNLKKKSKISYPKIAYFFIGIDLKLKKNVTILNET